MPSNKAKEECSGCALFAQPKIRGGGGGVGLREWWVGESNKLFSKKSCFGTNLAMSTKAHVFQSKIASYPQLWLRLNRNHNGVKIEMHRGKKINNNLFSNADHQQHLHGLQILNPYPTTGPENAVCF